MIITIAGLREPVSRIIRESYIYGSVISVLMQIQGEYLAASFSFENCSEFNQFKKTAKKEKEISIKINDNGEPNQLLWIGSLASDEMTAMLRDVSKAS